MDNRFATALVIGSVLSLLSVIYLSAAVGTISWYHYATSPVLANVSDTAMNEFIYEPEKANEKAYTDALYHCNGSLGLWKQCITVKQQHYDSDSQYTAGTAQRSCLSQLQCLLIVTCMTLDVLVKPPSATIVPGLNLLLAPCLVMFFCSYGDFYEEGRSARHFSSNLHCISLSFSDQFLEKYSQPGNHNTEIDLIRTYLWRCQFLLPLVALGLIFFGAIVGLAGCVCRSLYPALGTGALHLLAGVCTMGAVLCFSSGVYMLQKSLPPPPGVRGEYGWSFCLACVSSPLQIMAGALFLWASRASRKEYSLMKAYRVA